MADMHQSAKTEFVTSDNIRYAYRTFGNSSRAKTPLLFLIHFRGTMDYWDPLLINSVAAQRPVILFDNAGVGQSMGEVASTIREMAHHVIKFLAALEIEQVDVIGFSMGGYIAPLVHLDGPAGLVRKLIIAGSGASAGAGVENNPAERANQVAQLAGAPDTVYQEGFDKLFFYPSAKSKAAGHKYWKRIFERDTSTSGEERSRLVSYQYADGGKGLKAMSVALGKFKDPGEHADGTYDRLGDMKIPTFVGQGADDFMIPTVNSYVLQQKIPNARLKIFPDSGHWFLFQFAEEFAEDINRFLDLEE